MGGLEGVEKVDFHLRSATGNDRMRQIVDTVRNGVETHDHTRQDAPEKRALMTTKELAKFLGCSRRHIDRLRKRGLPDIKVGELVRFSEKAVLDWLEFQRQDFGGYGWMSGKPFRSAHGTPA
jgi:excisionase family DNA binding protein